MKKILIDIDGVACEHAKAICHRINKEYKINSKVEEVITWDHSFGSITFKQAVKKYYHDEDFIRNMEVTPGFYEFLNNVRQIMNVEFATNREEYCDESTRFWIKKNFGSDVNVYFIDKKINFVDFDYLIDDRLDEIVAAGKGGKTVFLYCRPWNDNKDTMKKLKKLEKAYFARNFKEILDLVKK